MTTTTNRVLKFVKSCGVMRQRFVSNVQTKFQSHAMKLDLVSSGPTVKSVLPAAHHTIKVIFDDHKFAEFKTIWLRDNCKCSQCVHEGTRQKLLDTPSLDVGIKPLSVSVSDGGNLVICWHENGKEHVSTFDSYWLYQYGQTFIEDVFDCDSACELKRPQTVVWGHDEIWKSFPEIQYDEVMESKEGLRKWLEMFCKYGIVLLKNVPPEKGKLVEFVNHFAYVKETGYGVTFDVIHEADPCAHPAFSGLYLHHHTDMNYREKSPGMQLLHCLKATDPKELGKDPGGMSFFVDGFRVAKWLEETDPASFHILASTPVRFQIKEKGKRYSQLWPVICVNPEGDVTEIHYNNRTMAPLQAPSHLVVPFYHAYKLFSEKMRDPSSELKFHMQPGDLVAFNNRRILHGRTGFDPTLVSRHLVGCYVDIDEAMTIYDSLHHQ